MANQLKEKQKKLKKVRVRNIVLNLVCICLAGSGLWWTATYFWRYVNYEVTNDAFVDQYVAPLNVRASGYIKEVCFKEHQYVRQGDTLLVLDNREYQIKVKEAEAAGADFVGGEEMIHKIQSENWFGFDVMIATPDMMGVVGRIGRILGPKGLMPNPKSGTVTMDVAKAVSDVKAGKVEYRVDKSAIIHCPIGKASFGTEKLTENLTTLMEAINKAKPAAAKGTYVRSLYISATMGPAVKVNPLKF